MRARLGEVAPPRERAPGREIPRELAGLAMAAMSIDPADRVPSATEFLESLHKFLRGDSDRRESIRLAAQVSERLAGEEESYGKYSDCLMDLGKAQALWKGNREVGPLFDEAHSRFCTLAMEKGDLALARLQAEALLDEPLKGEMTGRVAVREADVRRREAHRFWAISLVWILVFFCITIFAIYQKNLLEERQILDRERSEAVRYQKQTLDLVEAMMGDLQQRLEPAQQLGTLREVAYDVLGFLQTVRTDSPDIQNLILESLAETYMRIAMIERSAGDSGAAIEALDGYRSHASEWFGIMGRNPYAMTLFYHSHILTSLVLGEQGDVEGSRRMFLQALAAGVAFELDRRTRGMPDGDAWAGEGDASFLAEMAATLPEAESFHDVAGGEEALLRTIGLLYDLGRRDLGGTDEEQAIWFRAMGLSHYWFGEAFLRDRRWDVARLAYERAIPIMERSARDADGRILPMEAWSWDGEMRMSFLARIRLAECQAMVGEEVLAESTLRGLLELLEAGQAATDALPHGPKGAAWATTSAKAHRKLARVYLHAGDMGAANDAALRAREVSRTVALASPETPETILGEMLSADVYGLVMAAMWRESGRGGEAAESAGAFTHAIARAAILVRKDPLNMSWRSEALGVLDNATRVAEDFSQEGLEDLAEEIQEALRQVQRLVEDGAKPPVPAPEGPREPAP